MADLTSKTYKHTAPKGHENCFILIPIATNLNDSEQVREKYFDMVLDRMEKLTKQKIRGFIEDLKIADLKICISEDRGSKKKDRLQI